MFNKDWIKKPFNREEAWESFTFYKGFFDGFEKLSLDLYDEEGYNVLTGEKFTAYWGIVKN